MRHLVTGGSGFLGSFIARKLVERGETVATLDVIEDAERPAGIEYIGCDIRDRARVKQAMRGVDVVHHGAALVPLTKADSSYWQVNVEGSRIAAEEAARAGVRHFVHMSSSAVFGVPKVCPVTERTPTTPVEPYGRSKLAGEEAVREVCTREKLPLTIIRPRTTLATGRLGIFQILFEWIREGRDIYVIGSGNVPFQFLHAEDLLDAYMRLVATERPGTYNVGTDEFGTLRQGLERLIEHAGTKTRVRSLPVTLTIQTLRTLDWLGLSPLAPWHYLTYHKAFYFDMSPLLALGWKPKYSNDRMLQESYDWFRDNADGAASKKKGSPHRRRVKAGVLALLKRLS